MQVIKANRAYFFSAIIALVILCIFPFVAGFDSFAVIFVFMIFIYIIVSQGWNLVGGYTGQLSLGTHAFFALGGYTTAFIWIYDITHTWYYFDPLVMLLSGVVPAIFAFLIGIPLLSRLRGDYFAFGTLAVSYILQILINRTTKISGGEVGLSMPSSNFDGMGIYYWTGLFLVVMTMLTIFIITKSRIGLALRAIREDELSASSHGINILKYKVMSFMIGSFIIGVCGSLYSYYLFVVNPGSMMDMTRWMFYPLLICVLGGSGTIIGPVIGAVIVVSIMTFAENLVGNINPMLFGIIIIIIMKYQPAGLWGLKDRLFSRR